jgi:hypothetical protein
MVMEDYTALWKRGKHIQHKISHLAINLTILAGRNQIPAPERERMKKIADKMFKLAMMQLEPPK